MVQFVAEAREMIIPEALIMDEPGGDFGEPGRREAIPTLAPVACLGDQSGVA
jgi:hypothetical protein